MTLNGDGEIITNAHVITQGEGENREQAKRVFVEFQLEPIAEPAQLTVRVVDQGMGFDPEAVADPLSPENLLKSSGRGIFFMRSFMDDLRLLPVPGGGTEVRMVKKLG